jgi:hypothetical protein
VSGASTAHLELSALIADEQNWYVLVVKNQYLPAMMGREKCEASQGSTASHAACVLLLGVVAHHDCAQSFWCSDIHALTFS